MTFCGELEMHKTSVFSDLYCLPNKLALMGLRPVVFGPCTLGRTWGTRPRPLAFHCDVERSTVWRSGIPHLAKNERDAPNFLHAALDKAACASFIKEGHMKFAEPTKQHRKSGMWGTQDLWSRQSRQFQETAKASSSLRSATVVDTVPRGMEGLMARAWLWPSNHTRKADWSAPGSRCWLSQL
jgi:hypothetical protein